MFVININYIICRFSQHSTMTSKSEELNRAASDVHHKLFFSVAFIYDTA